MSGAPPQPFPLPLDELAARYGLDRQAVERLADFGAMLAYDELAPTTVRSPEGVRDDHLADALVALELPEIARADAIADIGAGAGVPGIPLAIALPETELFLVEGASRKCAFMRAAADSLGLQNVTVVNGRAETWHEGRGRCDAVTARALAALDIVEEYAAPLLRVGGSLIAWRGKRDPDVEAAGLRAAEILGMEVREPIPVMPYPRAENRFLHVITKVAETPDRFPRRDGVARKRPLGRG